MTIAIVRVRGTVNINTDTKDALRMLHLTRANHCTIIPENPQWRGTLLKVKDYVTWGKVDEKTLLELLTKRGRVVGGEPLTVDYLAKKKLPFKSLDELAKALIADKADLRSLDGIKPLFRLAPPKKGYEQIVHDYKTGGTLGDRGESINALIKRML
jgi:large subunit ribosomal protein L30